MTESLEHLIHDWNVDGETAVSPRRRVEFDDETLRDGLQSPSVTDPSIEDKLRILHYMNAIGIDNADIGLPGAGPHVQKTVERLAREIVEQKLSVYPSAAGRTHENDVRPIVEISNRVGIRIEADLFIGSSPIRQFAEEWDLDWIIEQSTKAVRFAVSEGIPVMYVTEDTTRAKPEDIEKLYSAAIAAGAARICIADTVGHATPWGARNLVRFVRKIVDRENPNVKIDWHGHEDRGLGVINCVAALEAGADRVHGSACGIGERVGNTPMDLLMVNLKLMGWIDNDLTALPDYVKFVSRVTGVPLDDRYPVFGRDAFRTGTGVHAAAIIKAKRKGSDWLADRVYSGVPAGMFGLQQVIEVGPMCGLSNVIYWLDVHGYPQEEPLAKELFQLAKSTNRVLTDDELHSAARRWQDAQQHAVTQ
ncbi:MAG: 2-isopropylmalate synthase [Acidobacteria bacterium]|nr:2-isopropylmalate synthase [Acidobacteriota bacterium]MBV9476836.1 2-isopropylmalate synthase [Acidobacteriota bacterium]